MKKFALFTCLVLLSASSVLGQSKVGSFWTKTSELTEVKETPSYQYARYSDRKSVWLAVGYSLLLPGLGELYTETFSSGRYYMAAEGTLWLTYAGFRQHGNWVRSDAKAFATQHSGASFDGKDTQFDVNIGNYINAEAYDQAKLRNREDKLRYLNSGYSWSWDSDANRSAFKEMRIRSDEIYNNSKFVIAGLIINRIVSAFNAGRAASSFNRNLRADNGWQFDTSPDGGLLGANGWKIKYQKEF